MDRERAYGRVTVGPDWPTLVVAGDPVSATVEYRSGPRGIARGMRLAAMWRLPADWGTPQFDDPNAPNFMTVEGEGPHAEWRLSFGHRDGVPPWSHRLVATYLGPDTNAPTGVVLRFGDRRRGSPGWLSPTASLPDYSVVFASCASVGEPWNLLEHSPSFRVASGPAAEVTIVGPSTTTVGTPIRLTVRGVDRWGNASRGGHDPPLVDPDDFETLEIRRVDWDGEPHDVWHVVGRFSRPGTFRPRVTWNRWQARGNPVVVREGHATFDVVWGDVHGGQGDLGVGQGSLDRYFAFADQIAGLQFTSHQANDVYVTQADWHHTRRVTQACHREGSFVALLGCEWTAPVDAGGDHNVVYLHDEPRLRRAQRWFLDEDDWLDAPTPPDLYEHLDGREALLNVHVGGFTSDLRFHDERLQRMVEIHSTHATSRWFVFDALERGYEMGIIGSSDGISGRPGACRPGRRQNRNLRNGVTGAYVTSLTRDGVWEALRRRHVYATTGERIVLYVEADGYPMGAAWSTTAVPSIDVLVEGTAAIDRILLRRGSKLVDERRLAPADPARPTALRLTWQGSRARGAARHQRLDWEGSLTLSSGTMHLLHPVGFEEVTDRVTAASLRCIDVTAVTAGNEVGIVVDLHAPDDAVLTFATSWGTWTWNVRDVRTAAGVHEVVSHLVDGHVSVAPPPDPGAPCKAQVTFDSPTVDSGHHAYWVEVVQVDGARAWSSPLFVQVVAQ